MRNIDVVLIINLRAFINKDLIIQTEVTVLSATDSVLLYDKRKLNEKLLR